MVFLTYSTVELFETGPCLVRHAPKTKARKQKQKHTEFKMFKNCLCKMRTEGHSAHLFDLQDTRNEFW